MELAYVGCSSARSLTVKYGFKILDGWVTRHVSLMGQDDRVRGADLTSEADGEKVGDGRDRVQRDVEHGNLTVRA